MCLPGLAPGSGWIGQIVLSSFDVHRVIDTGLHSCTWRSTCDSKHPPPCLDGSGSRVAPVRMSVMPPWKDQHQRQRHFGKSKAMVLAAPGCGGVFEICKHIRRVRSADTLHGADGRSLGLGALIRSRLGVMAVSDRDDARQASLYPWGHDPTDSIDD